MGAVERRIAALGLSLPRPMSAAGQAFTWVNVRGPRVFVAGHGPGEPGAPREPLGRVGAEVSEAEAVALAREAGLSVLGSLAAALGELDRVAGWCRVLGLVNAAPGYDRPHVVLDGFSRLVLDVFGEEVGRHARTAVAAVPPFGMAVEIEAELLVHE
ncbi:MAG: RidA family protein [Paracoccaceae bacterium]